MKTIKTVLFIISLIPGVMAQQASECQTCDMRVIECFDFDILTEKPTTVMDSMNWKQLHYASDAYVRRYYNTEDGNCLKFLPACRIGDFVPPWKSKCPYRGEMLEGVVDYSLSGEITGREGAYVMRFYLSTLSRETVCEVTKKFEKATEAVWMAEMASLQLGGTFEKSKPLNNVIREWEKNKRDEANGIRYNKTAINATLKFQSAPERVKCSEKVPMEIEVQDCDGVLIKSAKVELHLMYGTFETNVVETNDQGIAKAVYVAPGSSCHETITAFFYYDRPGGKKMTSGETVEFDVGGNPSLKISAERNQILTNETAPIFIKVNDLDVQRLRTTTVELSCKYGVITPTKARLDGKGNSVCAYTAAGERSSDTIYAVYTFSNSAGETMTAGSSLIINISDPYEHVKGILAVRIFEKRTEKEENRKISVVERNIVYTTDLTVKLQRENLNIILKNQNSFNPDLAEMPVAQGDSYYREWSSDNNQDPVIALLNPIDITVSEKKYGYRSDNYSDWDVLFTGTVHNSINFQHVNLSIKPNLSEVLGKLAVNKPQSYVVSLLADLIPERISNRDYAATSDGSAQIWNPANGSLEELPPPFACTVPYASDIFYPAEGDDKVNPPTIPAHAIESFVLKTMGNLHLNMTGNALRLRPDADTEITMEIKLTLTPAL